MLSKLIKNLHLWMMKDPKNPVFCKDVSHIIISLGILYITFLLTLEVDLKLNVINIIENITSIPWPYIAMIMGIVLLMLKVVFSFLKKFIEIVQEKEINFPLKYQLLFSIIFVPFIKLVYQIVCLFKPLIKDYAGKTETNK